MADAIVRLKVESQEYDQKLQRATQQLQYMEKEVRRTGATFAYADKEELAFIQSLGQMETKATSAKQKMREYSEAITSMVAMYRQMTNEEKNSQFGKLLSESIDQLKVKAAELQDVMSDTNREIQNLASDTSFTDGVNLMTRTVGSCAAAIAAWTGDSKEMEVVIKDLAKIGTTVAAVDALTKAFQKQNLVLLKNPYVAATAAALALGVALVKLSKHLNEASAAQKDLEEVQAKGRDNATKEITRIETLNNILHDNTRSMDERKTALQEIQTLVPEYHGALTTEGTLINDNTDALTGYVAELQRAATAQAAFDKMVEINKQKLAKQLELKDATAQRDKYQAEANRPITKDEMMAQAGSGRNVYGAVEDTKQTLLQAAQDKVDGLEKEIKEFNTELETLQGLVDAGGIVTSGKKTTTAAKPTAAKASGKSTGSEFAVLGSIGDWEQQAASVREYMKAATSTEEYKELEQELDFIIEKMNELKGVTEITFTPGSLNDLNNQLKEAQAELANMSPEAEGWADALENVRQKMAAVAALQGQINGTGEEGVQTAKSTTTAWQAAASALATAGAAIQQIDDPAAKIAGILATAVANIALGFASASAKTGGVAGVFGWIAATTAGLATMLSTITAIKSVTANAKGYAEGGMVGGSSYSGDNIVARLNSGEGVLTAKGVENAAAMANISNPFGNLQLSTKLTGTELLILLNNTNRSLGGSRSFYSERH